MPFRIRRILVAIRDERSGPRAALRKAAALARASGAQVQLFHAINEPQALDALRRELVRGHPTQEIIATVTQRAQKHLTRLAGIKEFSGLKVSTHASWDYPPHEAIIRQAMAIAADVIVASVQPRVAGGRLLLANTDWELIRHSPCPVLMIKSSRAWRKRAVVAAIDPLHSHDKPAALDRRILAAAGYLAKTLGGALHAFHAYMALASVAPAPGGQPMAIALPLEMEELHSSQVSREVDRIVEKFSVPPARRHVELGVPQDELLRVTRQTDADLVVLGAVSRSAWRRFVIGSTAEKALDRLACDLVVVKPRDFRTKVPRRATLAWLKG